MLRSARASLAVRSRSGWAALSFLVASLARPVVAQQAPPAADSVARVTSSAAPRGAGAEVTAARAAQRAFERTHRQGLRFYNGGAEARCEEKIGRLCYWNNNGDVPPPEERSEVLTERTALAALLARAAAVDPTDDWIAGQRVRYADEMRLPDEAARAAAACRGTAWWCAALRGTAAHVGNRHGDASAAFDSALALMPEKERCAWSDVSLWLEGKAAEAYRALPCGSAERRAWEARFWTLAMPLWMHGATARGAEVPTAGNDLRNELLARRVIVRTHAESWSPYDMTWGDDMAESELRYGWPVAWSVTTAGANDPRPPTVIGHEPTPSVDLVPRAAALGAPVHAAASGWALDDPRARMRYAPRYARRGFVGLDHQVARFRHGDSAVVVGAWDVETSRDWGSGDVRAALGLLDSTGARRVVTTRGGRRGALALTLPAAQRLMSLEVVGDSQARAGRARYGVTPLPGDARLSDLLLLRGGAGPTAELADVLPQALGSTLVRSGGTVGLFWESYLPASPGAPATVELTATRLNATRLERLRSQLRVGSAVRPVSVRFQDTGRPDGRPGRSLAVSWPEVPPGEYVVELTVSAPGAAPATTSLKVRVVE